MTFAPCLLRTHIRRSSGNLTTPAKVLVSESKTEIGDECLLGGVNQDVGGLDIPVDQSTSMSVVKGISDGRNQSSRLVKTGACFL